VQIVQDERCPVHFGEPGHGVIKHWSQVTPDKVVFVFGRKGCGDALFAHSPAGRPGPGLPPDPAGDAVQLRGD
jgi:hypothetical protein